jgi:hypothetical protein
VQFALSVGGRRIVSSFEWASEEKDVLELLNSYKDRSIRIRRDKYGRGIEGSGGSLDLKANVSVPMFEVAPNAEVVEIFARR